MRRLLTDRRVLRGIVLSLYHAARVARRVKPRRVMDAPCRVLHIAPSYFSDRSYIGGGERYAMNLAEAVSAHVETVLVSFGDKRHSFRQGSLKVEVYPALGLMDGLAWDPISYDFLRELRDTDVVHCYQYKTIVTNLAILAGAILRKRIFVTDLAGVGYHFADMFPLADFVDGFLPISAYSAKTLPQFKRTEIIYGGVDEHFVDGDVEDEQQRNRQALFVGRLLPHKGINYLIEGLDGDMPLEVIGRVYHDDYFKLLQQLARGKSVEFVTDAPDEKLIKAYRQSLVTVLPSVYVDVYGNRQEMPELLGLVMLESMASGTPVICTDVGGMPEFVVEGKTGFVVPPNNPQALRERVAYLFNNPEIALSMGREGKRKVSEQFTWDVVARRCLTAYRAAT